MMSPLLNIGSMIAGTRSKSMVLGSLHLCRFASKKVRKEGYKSLSLYLKASTQYLFAVQSGKPQCNSALYGPHVALTGGGVPRFIPVFWRRKMSYPC
jgi:hypothetical protein